MKNIGKTIRMTASKVAGGLGFNTRAGQVVAIKKTAADAKLAGHHNPVQSAKDIQSRVTKASRKELKGFKGGEDSAMSSAAKRELSRRFDRNLTIGTIGTTGVTTGVTAALPVAKSNPKRDKAAAIANGAK